MNKLIKNSLAIARAAIKKNRIRTVLTILGVVIGIASVTIIISSGDSMKKLVFGQVASFGSDFIQTEPRVPQSSGGMFAQAQGVVITTLKESDRQAILKLPYISEAYTALITQDMLSWQGQLSKSMIYGVSPEYIDIDQGKLGQGRFFTKEEDSNLDRVVVLGSKVKQDLFGESNAVGQNVKIKQMNFKVVGVMEPRGTVFFFNMDQLVFIPIQTVQKLMMGVDYVQAITSQLSDPSKEAETVDAIRQLLRERHSISDPSRDDFQVASMAEAKGILDSIIGAVTLLLVALAAISLVVGGVGIMNIMYASVAERTFEIGLRKSVGATKKDIMAQFLSEAVIKTFLGGAIGVILGIGVTYLVYLIANYYAFDWPFALSLNGIVLAIVFSVTVGLIFGLYPARKAANLDPITALRKE
ncbi:MAG: multidrug ABC transporter substrate-binding protein [Parcubacteria group bacterium]|nr:MAG: multidrug ABC transporter substrate-binding protein [Parcubacteria group bacterium]